jgi:hypothetical protein
MRPNPLCLIILGAFSVLAQSNTEPPAGQQAMLTATGKGVQIYTCQNAQWVFQAPEATLFDSAGKEIGTHGAGPVWTFQDGRSVKGQLVGRSDAPDAVNIPWLLLKGDGSFEYIRRSDTRGGVAPKGPCETGRTLRVDYSAVYTFYTHQ